MTRPGPRLFALLALSVLVLAACGGGGSGKKQTARGYGPRGYAGLGFKSPVAGTAAPRGYASPTYSSYTPTGNIVADNGFRPWSDGFSFENYGNEGGPQNMTPANMSDLFGSQVCIAGSGDSCQLTPAAGQFMQTLNQNMSGGHCMGFSVTALRMYTHNLRPTAFGASAVPKLGIIGNNQLQSELAENFVYQNLPAVTRAEIHGTPNDILDKLISSLKPGGETYTMGIFGQNGKPGGHAITPFAVEDQGGGHYNVLVYDNNFPDVVRAVKFDRNANTWEYRGGINPSDLNEKYGAGAQPTKAQGLLTLFPTSPGEGTQPFAFGGEVGVGSSGGGASSTVGGAVSYDQISLKGSVGNHAHLLIVDAKGNKMGYDNGQLVNDIPGANIVRPIADDINLSALPEPTYQIPKGLKVHVHIDGAGMSKPDKEVLTYISKGLYFEVSDINARPGGTDEAYVEGGAGGILFSTKDTTASAPYIAGGLLDKDHGRRAAYVMVIKAVDVKGGSNIGLVLIPSQHAMGVAMVAHPGQHDFGYGKYVIDMTRTTEDGKNDNWVNPNVVFTGPQKGSVSDGFELGSIGAIAYSAKDYAKTDKVPVIIADPNDHNKTLGTFQLSYSK